jgi:hypothetical protein
LCFGVVNGSNLDPVDLDQPVWSDQCDQETGKTGFSRQFSLFKLIKQGFSRQFLLFKLLKQVFVPPILTILV